MYKGKRARFTRNALDSVADMARKIFVKYINPTNLMRLQKTLDLSDVSDDKPSINGVMIPIKERLDEEERQAELEMEKRLRDAWSRGMLYDCMGEDYMCDDEGIILNPKYLKKKNRKLYEDKKKSSSKRGSRGKGKKNDYDAQYVGYEDYDDYWDNRKSLYTNGEWNEDDEDNCEAVSKTIKFYPDITNEMSVMEFHSLKEFSDFCDRRGYVVGETDYSNLKNWSVIHCCLDPIDMEYGDFAIITDNSYGALYWTVESDIPADVKDAEVINAEARTVTD
jgi:hypothetical protein